MKTYTISEISNIFNLPASTIRYYEQIGLLEDVEHINSYKRVYNQSHIDRLKAVECFKKALLPLNEIKHLFMYEKNMEDNSEIILAMMKKQETKTIKTMNDLAIGLNHLQKKIKYYSLVNDAIKEGKPLPLWDDI